MANSPYLGIPRPVQGDPNVVPVIDNFLLELEDAVVNGPGSSLNHSLMAFWKLEEASGTRSDSVGSNHLTDVNTVTQLAGKVGMAAQFTAANSEYLSIADNPSLSMGNHNFTVSAWVYLNSLTGFRAFVYKGSGATSTTEFGLDYSNVANRFRFLVSDGTTLSIATANVFGVPVINTWYFLCARHDATANKIYLSVNNGTEDETAHSVGSFDSAQALTLGSITGGGAYMDGRIDAVGVWKKALNAAEITALYNVGNGFEWPF